MPSVGLLLRTLSRYEPGQLWNYALRRIRPISVDTRPAPPRRAVLNRFVPGIARAFAEVKPSVFRLLNVEHRIENEADWNAPHIERLWLYTLHYQEWLSADHAHADQQRSVIERWIAQNPPAHGNGWDPYPISLRAVQWIKWVLRGEIPPADMIDSLAVQVRHLRRTLEFHLGANHLFANAVALVAAGLFFEGTEPQDWYDTGASILQRELPRQYHVDGGHFELSSSYHALLLESLLDLENLANTFGVHMPRPWQRFIPPAMRWMQVMTRADSTFPRFNDCIDGSIPTTAQVNAYADAIGVLSGTAFDEPITDLPETGYLRLRKGPFDVHIDAGPFAPRTQPGHGHCDMLSFELAFDGKMIVVNTGTSTYERSARRAVERGTAAHNTVQIGQAEQSEIWSAFRAGRTARIIERRVAPDTVVAAHNGYEALGIKHRRTFKLDDELSVTDEIIGKDAIATARIHFAPGIEPQVEDNATFRAGPLRIVLRGSDSVRIADYEYAAEFNLRYPAKVLEIDFRGRLDCVVQRA